MRPIILLISYIVNFLAFLPGRFPPVPAQKVPSERVNCDGLLCGTKDAIIYLTHPGKSATVAAMRVGVPPPVVERVRNCVAGRPARYQIAQELGITWRRRRVSVTASATVRAPLARSYSGPFTQGVVFHDTEEQDVPNKFGQTNGSSGNGYPSGAGSVNATFVGCFLHRWFIPKC
jgi:hypothetical protein